MDSDGIQALLEEVRAENVRVYTKNVQCSCFLADWREGHSQGSDHAGSMGISIDPNGKSRVNCFSCHFGGTLVEALSALGRYSGRDYSKLIQSTGKAEELDPEYVANNLPKYDEVTHEEKFVPTVVGESVFRMLNLSPGAHASIVKRGIEIATLKEWDTRYDPKHKRVVFPVHCRDSVQSGCASTIVGASGRTVFPGGRPTYYNYFLFDKSQYLFGENFHSKETCGVVVEGILDAVAVRQELKKVGIDQEYCVVGIMGSSASEGQAKKLIRWFDEVVLFLDNDPAGWTGSRKLAVRLQRSLMVRAVKYPKNSPDDPAALMQKGAPIAQLIQDAPLVVARQSYRRKK